MGKEAAKKGGAAGRYYAAKGGENVGCGKRHALFCNHLRMILFVFGLMGSFFLLDSLMLTVIHHFNLHRRGSLQRRRWIVPQNVKSEIPTEERAEKIMYARLLALASAAISKNEIHDSIELFKEPNNQTSTWRSCSDQGNQIPQVVVGRTRTRSGYILVSANGGLNQQRVAVCNAVAVAALLNAYLVIPNFLYSSVWKDTSQFGDIYQEDFFMNYLKNDVDIVKELPSHLQSLDIEAIGSLITDNDIRKESTPEYFLRVVFPLLLKNGVVHFYGFGNRLAFDPLPLDLQKLRCKCNFHALKYAPRIQEIGSLLVRRIRKYNSSLNMLDEHLFGKHMPHAPVRRNDTSTSPVKYLAMHMRFEMDMVAYSLCDFDGGEKERRELQAYREVHFPTLTIQIKNNNSLSPEESRSLGKCPLTPEEAAIMLTALGYNSRTYIYLAGSRIYGGRSRMLSFTRLYPNVITKEDVLTPSELAPFKNFSSQLAALDFIACAAADVFAMTDSGSQLSSLVNGYRIYHGRDHAPTIRPNKKRFARILSENRTIQWHDFGERVRKMVQENQRIIARRKGRSIYRLPRTPGCMCKY
ncbi:O-fucosyltransferase 8-like [Zingiber officinale]|uniref:O-fucosyltransferase 8-like n=1 Tax=Zingiber officinale TaxID=94328 RepID=UPI001C4B019B|nr:O-fucosyltransferase 8-like [Zingiber officinale]